MPRQPQSTGLFGQTPAAIRQAQINEQINQASMIGSLGPGGHGALAGGAFGKAIGHGVGLLAGQDMSDPRLRQAQALQEIEQEITQMGLEPGTREFTETLGQLATMKLGVGAAAPIVQKAQQLEIERAEIEQLRQGPAMAERKMLGLARILNRMGYDEQDAYLLAQNEDIAETAIKENLKPKKLAAAIELYERAKTDKGFNDWYMASQKAKGGSVRVQNYLSKPLGNDASGWRDPQGNPANPGDTPAQAAADGFRPITAEAQAAATKAATLEAATASENKEAQQAIGQLRGIVDGLSVQSAVSPTDRGRYGNARVRLAKAIAQKRNPGDAEASAQAEERLLNALPSLEQAILFPGAVEAIVGDLDKEVGGGGSDKRIEDMSDAELWELAK